jgi:hypothetical protein
LEIEIDYLRTSHNALKEKIDQTEAEKEQLLNQLRDTERRANELAKAETEEPRAN